MNRIWTVIAIALGGGLLLAASWIGLSLSGAFKSKPAAATEPVRTPRADTAFQVRLAALKRQFAKHLSATGGLRIASDPVNPSLDRSKPASASPRDRINVVESLQKYRRAVDEFARSLRAQEMLDAETLSDALIEVTVETEPSTTTYVRNDRPREPDPGTFGSASKVETGEKQFLLAHVAGTSRIAATVNGTLVRYQVRDQLLPAKDERQVSAVRVSAPRLMQWSNASVNANPALPTLPGRPTLPSVPSGSTTPGRATVPGRQATPTFPSAQPQSPVLVVDITIWTSIGGASEQTKLSDVPITQTTTGYVGDVGFLNRTKLVGAPSAALPCAIADLNGTVDRVIVAPRENTTPQGIAAPVKTTFELPKDFRIEWNDQTLTITTTSQFVERVAFQFK